MKADTYTADEPLFQLKTVNSSDDFRWHETWMYRDASGRLYISGYGNAYSLWGNGGNPGYGTRYPDWNEVKDIMRENNQEETLKLLLDEVYK